LTDFASQITLFLLGYHKVLKGNY